MLDLSEGDSEQLGEIKKQKNGKKALWQDEKDNTIRGCWQVCWCSLISKKKQKKNTENHADWPAWEFLIVFSAAYLFLYEINLLILLLDIVVWGFRLDVLNIQSII